MGSKRYPKTFMSILLVLVLAGPVGALEATAQTADGKSVPASTITNIGISFKLDPRLQDSTYGGERWVSPLTFTGATAQDTVEARAQGVEGKGLPVKISPEWVSSDPEMVTVAPSQGDQVKITVHRAGESTLKVAAQGFSKELVVRAKYLGKFIQVEISQPAAGKPEGAALAAPTPAVFESQKAKLSYAVGMNLAKALQKQSVEVDADLLIQGFKDTLSGGQTLMTEEQVQATLMGVQTELRNARAASQAEKMKELAEKNKKEGEAFLAENKKKEGVVTLPTGLQYKILKAGDGKKPGAGAQVVCQYRGTLIDGTEFDNSSKRKGPTRFPLKAVIKGWREALQLMPVGSRWQLFIPPDLAYGERPPRRSNVGPNATLIFEVELLSVQEASRARISTSDSTDEKSIKPETIEAVKKAARAEMKQ